MAKRKHSADWMLAIVREYLSGKGSYRQIARSNGVSERSLRGWVRKYEEQDEASFMERAGNASYSKKFKASCVLAALRGEGSVDNIVVKYNISSHSVLRHWMKQYNDHIQLKDYNPKREVYMAGRRKKTSLSERKKIVEYCLSYGKNYKDTAARYDVSYSQVYDWVRKYATDGEVGLIDRRQCDRGPVYQQSVPVQALEAGYGAIHVPRWALHRQLPSGRFLRNCEGRDVFPE